MVATLKFSSFGACNLDDSSNQIVGYGSSNNFQGQKVILWTTGTRPASPINGLLGFNTDLEEYEFWNAVLNKWSQISSSTNNLAWNNVTTLTQNMESNNGYVANNVGQVVMTLPTTANFGEQIRICGYGSGGWQLIFNSGQNVVVGNVVAATSTGSVSSINAFDQLSLLCVVANTTWICLEMIGNLFIVN